METAVANVTPASGRPIPDAAKYQRGAIPTTGELNAAFDDRLISRMKGAKNWAMWGEILAVLMRAKNNKNLRPAPREFFFDDCPHPVMVEELRKEAGCPAGEKKPASTDNGERARAEARRAANRAERQAKQPRKGTGGGGGNKHQSGAKGKGGKKK